MANEKEFVNVVSAKVDKFKGLRRISEMIWGEVVESGLMYWGNDFNDLEALEGCGIGVVVNSYPEIAERLVTTLERKKNFGYTLIIDPDDIDLFLKEISKVRSGGGAPEKSY